MATIFNTFIIVSFLISIFYRITSSILSSVEPVKSREKRRSHSGLKATRYLKKQPLNAG